jgi:NAD(P)-dependent dehydrogenase (short-subunit alcohol dehydrogenase family)
MSGYGLSKLVALQMANYIGSENPNVTATALAPGIVDTDMTIDSFKPFALDTPELVGGTTVWLATDKAKFLNRRLMNVNWDVDELYERREEIMGGSQLQIGLGGTFGPQQFE